MNDETKDELMKRTREWLQSCVNAATRSGVPEEADLEAFILAHLDGEPARLAAAREEAIMEWRAGAADRDELRADCERRIAAAREEQREACALDAEERVGCASTYDEIRSVPLDATPLADELRTLRAKYDELHTAAGNWLRQRDLAFDREEEEVRAQLRELREVAERNVADVQHLRQSSIALTDDRDELRADCERRIAAAREEQCEALGLSRWPVLVPFIAAMVRKLDANKPKKGGREGWQNDDPQALLARVREEVDELAHAVAVSPRVDILHEAADVANMAMMVADSEGAIRDTPLDATPLADELRTLRERMAVVLHAGPSTGMAVAVFDRAKKAEAQVAAARAVCEGRIKTHWRVPDVYITATEVLRAMDEAAKK